MLYRAILAAMAAFLLLASPAAAHSVKIGALSLTGLWTRATPPSAPTAGGYLTIDNTGAEADRLISVASPIAGQAMLHEMSTKDGTMTMRPVAGIEIPAGAAVALAPGGFHIMFMDLKETFVEGGKVPVTFTFEKAGNIDTFLPVLGLGARGPEGDHPHDGAALGSGQ
jgi:periplasmic copper chaperone A